MTNSNQGEGRFRKIGIALASILLVAGAGLAPAEAAQINFPGYCDGFAIKDSSIYSVGKFTGCGKGSIFEGFRAKIEGVSYLVLSVNYDGGGSAATYLIQYPIEAGNTYYVFLTDDGVTQTEAYTGSYELGAPDATKPAMSFPSSQKHEFLPDLPH